MSPGYQTNIAGIRIIVNVTNTYVIHLACVVKVTGTGHRRPKGHNKKVLKPEMKKTVNREVIAHFGPSERRACALTGINRASYRYKPEKVVDDDLWDNIKQIAEQYPKYGYRMITLKLLQQNILANHKRIERVYREEGLQLAKRQKRRKTSKVMRNDPEPVSSPNEEWAMDFVSDTLHNGGRFHVVNLIDIYNRMVLNMQARSSISGLAVTRFLDASFLNTGSLEGFASTMARSSQAKLWTNGAIRMASIFISSNHENRRRTGLSKVSMGRSEKNASAPTGSGQFKKLRSLSKDGRRNTTKSALMDR